MVGWILLLVVLALVLLACVLRLGVAAGYEEGGGWVKVHLGPKWVSLYPVPQARTARRRKKQRRKEAKAEATEDQKDREKFSLGGALEPGAGTAAPGQGGGGANSAGRAGGRALSAADVGRA